MDGVGLEPSELPRLLVEDLGLSVRTVNCLKKHAIDSLQDLATYSRAQLLILRGLGTGGVAEIDRALREYAIKERNTFPLSTLVDHSPFDAENVGDHVTRPRIEMDVADFPIVRLPVSLCPTRRKQEWIRAGFTVVGQVHEQALTGNDPSLSTACDRVTDWLSTSGAVRVNEELEPAIRDRLARRLALVDKCAFPISGANSKISQSITGELARVVDSTLASALRMWGCELPAMRALVICFLDVLDAIDANCVVDPMSEINAIVCSERPRDAKILALRHGLRGTAPRTLESIGFELNITRERVRQLAVRTEAKLFAINPPLAVAPKVISVLEGLDRAISLSEWLGLVPEIIRPDAPDSLRTFVRISSWGWTPGISIKEVRGEAFVLLGDGRENEIAITDRRIAPWLHRITSAGAISLNDISAKTDIDVSELPHVLQLPRHWIQIDQDWWVHRHRLSGPFAQQIRMVLTVFGRMSVAQLRRRLRRHSMYWRRIKMPFPPLRAFPTLLKQAGFEVDAEGIVTMSVHQNPEYPHGAERLVTEVLRDAKRPLTLHEVTIAVKTLGGTPSMAGFFLSQSPLVTRVGRGIYSFSEEPEQTALRAAKRRRLAQPGSTIRGSLVSANSQAYVIEFQLPSVDYFHTLYIPTGTIARGSWRIQTSDHRLIKVRHNYVTGLINHARRAIKKGASVFRVEFRRDDRTVRLTYRKPQQMDQRRTT